MRKDLKAKYAYQAEQGKSGLQPYEGWLHVIVAK